MAYNNVTTEVAMFKHDLTVPLPNVMIKVQYCWMVISLNQQPPKPFKANIYKLCSLLK